MKNIGVIEGFFGPPWSDDDRISYASFLSEFGGDFYLYAPKQDSSLRKEWRSIWCDQYLTKLKSLCNIFHQHGVKFGVGFSPFSLGTSLSDEDRKNLKTKIEVLNSLKLDILGVFFDDMPITKNLSETQLSVVSLIRESFQGKIIFCPSFYSFDPILEKVFGEMPDGYFEDIAEGTPQDIALAWTGPKVISSEIPQEHLLEVKKLLNRSPYLWENFFANEGPKNCKFLKMKPFSGRDPGILNEVEGIAFNLMNQPQLSKILFLSSLYVLKGEASALDAFDRAVETLCSNELFRFLKLRSSIYLNHGLDGMSDIDKEKDIRELSKMPDLAAREIQNWLKGHYVVGPECLTD